MPLLDLYNEEELQLTQYIYYFNGTTYVLLTLPFTLLCDVEIDVELPKVKRLSIDTLGCRTNAKFFRGFNGRRWRTKYGSVGMSYSDNSTENIWDNSQLQAGNNGDVKKQASNYLAKLNHIYPGITKDYNGKAYRFNWPKFPLTKGSYSSWKVVNTQALRAAK